MEYDRCKNCESDITYLKARERTTISYDISLDGEGLNYDQDDVDMEDAGKMVYYCPDCGAMITTSEKKAIEILKKIEEVEK